MIDDVEPLVEDMRRKDLRFKTARAVFVCFVVAGIATLLLLEYNVQVTNERVLKVLSENSTKRTQQIQSLQNHIDCIVLLFQKQNRSALYISDLENCKIQTVDASSQPTSSPLTPAQLFGEPALTTPFKAAPAASPAATAPKASASPTPTPTPSPAPQTNGQPSLVQRINKIISGLL